MFGFGTGPGTIVDSVNTAIPPVTPLSSPSSSGSNLTRPQATMATTNKMHRTVPHHIGSSVMFALVVEGLDQPKRRASFEGAISIGRSTQNDVVLPRPEVSRRHACIK